MRRFNRGRFRALCGAAAALWVVHLMALATDAAGVCAGDCNENDFVDIAEVQTCVNLANDLLPVSPCPNADYDGDGTVDQNDVDACVLSFLDASSCPVVVTPAVPTSTPVPTDTNTPVSVDTSTPVPTSTDIPVPTGTDTPVPTSTHTAAVLPTATPGEPIGDHKCVLVPGLGNSEIQLFTALFNPILLPSGSVDISCGSMDGGTGKAPCSCGVQSFEPFSVPGIGNACLAPTTAPCASGEVDCDGGNFLSVDVEGTHGIGACTGNADCEASCVAHCAASTSSHLNSGCDGFCSAGAEQPCTDDDDCLPDDGACNGKDLNPTGNICQCTCVDIVGPASGAGALQCQLAFNLKIEANTPNQPNCDGIGDTILIDVGDACAPLTTENLDAVEFNANPETPPVTIGPIPTESGSRISCDTFATSTTTGLFMKGATVFYGSTIGDIVTVMRLKCQ